MQRNAWSGWIALAGWLMVIIGSIDSFEGVIAIIRGRYSLLAPQEIIVFDIKTWGWITLFWGVHDPYRVRMGRQRGLRCGESHTRARVWESMAWGRWVLVVD